MGWSQIKPNSRPWFLIINLMQVIYHCVSMIWTFHWNLVWNYWAFFFAVRRVAKYLNKDCLMKLFHAFIISNFNYCAIVWHFCSKSSTIKMEKIQKAALRVVFNDYDADYNQLLSMSERSPLLVVRLRTILIEVFKCIRELNPKFMNMLFTLNNKPYDTRSGPLLFQSHVKTIKHGINSFMYQGAKRWNSLPTDAKDIECFNWFKNFLTTWMGPDCHCVLCAIKTM